MENEKNVNIQPDAAPDNPLPPAVPEKTAAAFPETEGVKPESQPSEKSEPQVMEPGKHPEALQPPAQPAGLKRVRKIQSAQLSPVLRLAAIVFVFAVFGMLALYTTLQEETIGLEAMKSRFEHRIHKEEVHEEDTSNFNKGIPSNERIERLPYTKVYGETTPSNPATTSVLEPGNYTLNYDMNVRTSPDQTSSSKTVLGSGTSVQIVSVQTSDDGTLWGQLADGGWVCMKSSGVQYVR